MEISTPYKCAMLIEDGEENVVVFNDETSTFTLQLKVW